MAGLILLVALIAFLALIIWLSGLLTLWLPLSSNWKALLRVVIVVGVFPLMLIDEIIGKHQFEALCQSNGIESMDVSKIKGKSIRRESGVRYYLSGQIIPIKSSNEVLRDAQSSEILLKYNDYFAAGGWVMRHTPLGLGSSSPMLFDGNGCGFWKKDQIFLKNQITQVN